MTEKTKKQKIVDALHEIAKAMLDETTGDVLWATVNRGSPDNNPSRGYVLPGLFIEEGDDDVMSRLMANHQDRALNVYLHFRFSAEVGVDSYERVNYYHGRLQAAFLPDPICFLDGLAITIEETAMSPEVFVNDASPGGQMAIQVLYRLPRGNPYAA